jgi:DNA-binding response OmpR family regulator
MNTPIDPREVRILVADDNRDAANALAVLLDRARFTVVAVAHDGAAALAAIDRFRPSIAILDVVMPEFDGYEIADRVRRQFAAPPRLIAVSGLGRACDRADALKAGFAAYFQKPVAWEHLEELLHSFADADLFRFHLDPRD